eukprot:CAMPEP_0197729282 /NCGR_PEP_ID=MMETSP1434-20131217/30004_1 /TAXON_ID=265543 /ORGANISM="Minutocellus polymorphus, Strain CCMP3303" /LENGTH=126 /DNA_ID=CAMNT_0043315887 /DNA_START=65 /DNA_END=441 /DNA_ORIENTATION=-
MHQLGITVGILLSQALSTPSLNLLGSVTHWQWLFFVPCVTGILELCVLPFCPESPSYLFATEGEESARQSLERLLPSESVGEYLDNIRSEASASQGDASKRNMSVAELFREHSLRKQLIVGIAVQL